MEGGKDPYSNKTLNSADASLICQLIMSLAYQMCPGIAIDRMMPMLQMENHWGKSQKEKKPTETSPSLSAHKWDWNMKWFLALTGW